MNIEAIAKELETPTDYVGVAIKELGSEVYEYPNLLEFLGKTQEYIEKLHDELYWEAGIIEPESFWDFIRTEE